jgi:hypothetical protein
MTIFVLEFLDHFGEFDTCHAYTAGEIGWLIGSHAAGVGDGRNLALRGAFAGVECLEMGVDITRGDSVYPASVFRMSLA